MKCSDINKTYLPAVLDSGDMMTSVLVTGYNALINHLNSSYNGGLFGQSSNDPTTFVKCEHSTADISGIFLQYSRIPQNFH